jgi:predicted aspartyl protease
VPVAELPIQRNGLIVEVDLGPSAAYRAALWKRGQAVPQPVRGTFLVDTGCDSTTVSEQMLRSLNLPVISQTRVVTGTTGAQGHAADVYAVSFSLLPHTAQPRNWSACEVVALPLLNQSIDGLLGRDLLNQVVLTYDGPRMLARLTY